VAFRDLRGRDRPIASRLSDSWSRKAQFRGLPDGHYYGAVNGHRERGFGRCQPARTETVKIVRKRT
jgi:hypothetical protein